MSKTTKTKGKALSPTFLVAVLAAYSKNLCTITETLIFPEFKAIVGKMLGPVAVSHS